MKSKSLIVSMMIILISAVPIFAEDIQAPYRLAPLTGTIISYHCEGDLDNSLGNGMDAELNNIEANDYVAGIDGSEGCAVDVEGYRDIVNDEYGYRIEDDPGLDIGTDDFTIEMVFMPLPTSENLRQGLIGKKEHGGLNEIGWELALRDGYQWVSLDIGDGVNGESADFSNAPSLPNSRCPDGTWVYLACVVDRIAGTASLYKDGQADPNNPVDISSVTGSVYNNTKKFYVAFHESNPHHSFTGLIDEVCITKRKLTETEIQNRIYQPVDLNLIYNVDDFSFDIVQGLTATKMLSVVSNNTAGYFRTLSDASWITIEPDSVYINPGDSVVITTTFNTSGIDYGNHETSIYFESDIPDVHGFSIPVEMAVFPNVDIDISGNSSIFQTGDTLSAYITVTNSSNYMTEAWIATAMRLPNGTLYGPVFGPYNFRLFPYGMVSGRIDHIVPGNAIVGDYEYLVRISTYSDMLTVMGQNGAEFSIYSSSQVSESYEENLWETFFSGFNNGNEKSIDNIPNEFILRQNRPNPFNATTAINFSLSQSSEIRLDIYNIRGQKVESLISGHYSEGEYSVDWDASDYSSGVYFYKLSTDKNAFTKRMTLLK